MKSALKVIVLILFTTLLGLFVAFKAGYIHDHHGHSGQTSFSNIDGETPGEQTPVDTITMAAFQANEKAKHMAMSSKSMTLSSTASYEFYTPVDTLIIDGVEYVVVFSPAERKSQSTDSTRR